MPHNGVKDHGGDAMNSVGQRCFDPVGRVGFVELGRNPIRDIG